MATGGGSRGSTQRKHGSFSNPTLSSDADDASEMDPIHAANLESLKESHWPALPESINDTLDEIERFCTSRGEIVTDWLEGMRKKLRRESTFLNRSAALFKSKKSTPQNLVLEDLHNLLRRLRRGEMLLAYDRETRRLAQPLFDIGRILSGGSGKNPVGVDPPLREEFAEKYLPSLEDNIYEAAASEKPVPLDQADYEKSIRMIASVYFSIHPKQRQMVHDWMKRVLELIRLERRYRILSAESRWNVIVAFEFARSGRSLPKPEAMVNGLLDSPRNDSNSV